MNNKIKSVLASCLVVSMLFSACGETDTKKKDEKKDDTTSASEYKFNFTGLNDVLGYAKNSFNSLENSLDGDISTGASTDLSIELGEMLTSQFGYDVGKITISNNAKVKDKIFANNLSLKYNDKSLASFNCVVDNDGVGYVQIPELSDAYLKADLVDLIEGETGTSFDTDSFEIPEEFEKTLEAFDEEKVSNLFENYIGIIEKHVPDSEKGDNYTGKINELEYTYETKEYKVDGKIGFDCVSEILNEVKNDKEIAALWNEIVDMQKKEAADSGYYSDEELEEYYPSFETSISEYIDSFNAGKDDAYSSDDLMVVKVYYDGDRTMGFNVEVDGEGFTLAMIDEKTSFGVGFTVLEVSEDDEEYTYSQNTQMGFTIEGEDGKYDGKLAYTCEYSDSDGSTSNLGYELTFDTDVEIVDEKTGAFKGDINFGMNIGEETLGLTISSNSTADKADISFTAKYNDQAIVTIGIVNVITDATDITVPSGKTYDISNDTDMAEFSQNCDLEGFLTSVQTALGEDLYNAIFNSSVDDEWEDDDWDFSDDDWDFEEEYGYLA